MKKSVVLLAAVLTANAFAQDGVYLGEPGYAGSGCPQGSAAAILSPDATELSILFSEYVAQAGGYTGKRLDRKNCSIAVPVHVPNGYSVTLIAIDYRGYNSIPRGGTAALQAEYFFAGSRGPVLRRNFVGPVNSDYTVTNNLIASAQVWSPCGAQVTLRANTSLTVQTNARQEEVLSTVDSADVAATMIYKLQWRRCY